LITDVFGVGGDGAERGGEHGEGDVPVPDVVAADLVVVQAGLVLGELEGFLDGPADRRYVNDLCGWALSAVVSPTLDQTGPADDLARYVREQWSIESLHWIRDTLYHKDRSAIRTRRGHPAGCTPYGQTLHHTRTHNMVLERP
jgi:hypothetical protein